MMESAKPIEAGCRAMVITDTTTPYMVGKIVGVIEFAGLQRCVEGHFPFWSTDDGFAHSEPCLMRIDDPDIQDQLEEESRKSKLDKYKDKVYANIHRSDTPGI